MKYGILEYKNPNVINIGDAMQILAIENLYRQIGIRDVVRINYFDLQTYDGEEIILPVCFPFYGYNSMNRVTCFSDKIIPIFLSLSLYDTNLEEDEIRYLKKCEPIGCRDEHTARGLADKGIYTYLSGCMTLTLDLEIEHRKKAIYCIDVPDNFYDFIPAGLKNDVILRKTHIFKNISFDTDQFAERLLREYAEEAKLVITSRLHAAIPCYAVGIPVIFIHREYSYRFSWLEDIIPVYLPEEWENIIWNGHLLYDNEKALQIKKLMTEIAKKRICTSDIDAGAINQLQIFYREREKRNYSMGPVEEAIKYIRRNWSQNETVEYGIWGVGQVAAALIEFIKREYPAARLVEVIDAKKTEVFKGCIPKSIDLVEKIDNLFIFVTADAVNPYAIEYFEKIHKNSGSYLLCWKHIECASSNLVSV